MMPQLRELPVRKAFAKQASAQPSRGIRKPRRKFKAKSLVRHSSRTQRSLRPLSSLKSDSTTSRIRRPKKQTASLSQPCMIMTLPTELHFDILRNLDYQTLLRVSATNKHFRKLFLDQDKRLFKLALLDFEEKSLAWRTSVAGEATYAPCYGCLKTLSKCHFRSRDWLSSSTSTGERAFKRRCETCSSKHPLTGKSRVSQDGGWLYCEGCKAMTHLAQYEWCGVWDHTRKGKVSCLSRYPLQPDVSLCKECKPWDWMYEKERSDAKVNVSKVAA